MNGPSYLTWKQISDATRALGGTLRATGFDQERAIRVNGYTYYASNKLDAWETVQSLLRANEHTALGYDDLIFGS